MDDGSRLITLSQGAFATVDAADYEWLSKWKWTLAVTRSGNRYAVRGDGSKRSRTTVRLHHAIMGKPEAGYEWDHRDGDGLNNRRSNLRKCTRSQNNQNQKKVRGAVKFKGVSFSWRHWCYISAIKDGQGKNQWVGRWNTAEEAARAYDSAALLMYGEFASLNFPGDVKSARSVREIYLSATFRAIKKPSSGFYGVYLDKGRYRVTVYLQSDDGSQTRRVHGGMHDNPIDAARSHDRIMLASGKPRSRMNFPEDLS